MNPTLVIAAEVLRFALEIYRRHAGKPADWLPTPEDWQALEQDVRLHSAAHFHRQAAITPEAPSSSP